MGLPAFDTHKFVRKFKDAGFDEQQAEVLISAVWESQASSDFAKKQDIADLRRDFADAEERTDAKLDKLGTELRHEIGDLRKDNELLRKDMDAKFVSMEERFNAKLDKLGLQIVNKLGGLIIIGIAIPVLLKYFT